ncbi:hypothetical protein [Chitinophaga sancti]|uniref:HTH cro/C1-type domain-containing protein n=1 Tax=Chitinophaga sancti TaxID=1004 RepID=A0A1K1M141_9BACT|nr:hypothetical protein [Chitinophaga sancti]WQD64710.1 hypothetical protein U0033_09910 [Chitinophaga sancti]WQG89668.1 hypothetical protein SR876_32565 [Chitinophaga sancti]SFW16850.1 hypothetical protein SAMN05661012_00363 [Chitinophaga sancti]
MAEKLFIANQRMLQLIEFGIENELASTQKEFLEKIGFAPGNIGQVRSGIRSFTIEQILTAASITGANMNWVFGLEKNMLRDEKKLTPLESLKLAVTQIEEELQPKKKR